jgi:amyloid beta precursor protein binding protein 1
MLETRTIAHEFKSLDLSSFDADDEDPRPSPVIWYLLLRAVGTFVSAFGRYPGANASDEAADATWLVQQAQALASGSDLAAWVTEDHANEMTRSCEVELHNLASLMGGVAAQEAVKIVTHQFVPLNHTYIFNGISGHAGTYAV